MTVKEGDQLWEPTGPSKLSEFMEEKGFSSYQDLWQWSVDEIEEFWGEIWLRYGIGQTHGRVLGRSEMPGAEWFPDDEVNYAEQVFRQARPGEVAVLYASEKEPVAEITWDELRDQTARCAAGLRRLGVERGDRVASYMPNVPETLVALLACTSIGAVWESCAPEFGARAVVDRFGQTEPKVLLATEGYWFRGKYFDCRERIRDIEAAIPSIEHTVLRESGWESLLSEPAELRFERLPFGHPLWILFSSGTTGLPKALVQSHGGIVLEHTKIHNLQSDIRQGDHVFWYSTTGWMLWNYLVGTFFAGATIVLYDGAPDPDKLWPLGVAADVTSIGFSPGFLELTMKAGYEPERPPRLRNIATGGAPLPVEAFEWVYEKFPDVWLYSASGGTEMCNAFIGGCSVMPVYAGELQARMLGAAAYSFSEDGQPLVEEVGELVLTKPLPAMPLFLWADENDQRYHETYFDMYPGVWRHSDWVKITDRGSAVIYGRSDATINRGGVRIGTAEIYEAVESVPAVFDSLVVDVNNQMLLFIVLREQASMSDELEDEIRNVIRSQFSARHVPNSIEVVPEIPRTLSGKKLEVPVRNLLRGADPAKIASRESLVNPAALDWFLDKAARAKTT